MVKIIMSTIRYHKRPITKAIRKNQITICSTPGRRSW